MPPATDGRTRQQFGAYFDTARAVGNATNLHLLKAVDETIDEIAELRRAVNGLAAQAEAFRASLLEHPPRAELDPEQMLEERILSLESTLRRAIETAGTRREKVLAARVPHGEAIAAELDELVGASHRLVGAFQELRWTLMECDHDAAKHDEPTPARFESVDALLAELMDDRD